jgi:hypothetical protein
MDWFVSSTLELLWSQIRSNGSSIIPESLLSLKEAKSPLPLMCFRMSSLLHSTGSSSYKIL